MQWSRKSFLLSLFFAFSVIIVIPAVAVAQDMPPILAPLAPPAAPATPAPASPSAEAVIPPATVAPPAEPAKKEHVATANRLGASHRATKPTLAKKFAALTKRLTTHGAAHEHGTAYHVAVNEPVSGPPPGAPFPPPGYYPPGPYEHLVYGGPPIGPYGGWGGYRGRYPYYP
jgi:hypothetical protein